MWALADAGYRRTLIDEIPAKASCPDGPCMDSGRRVPAAVPSWSVIGGASGLVNYMPCLDLNQCTPEAEEQPSGQRFPCPRPPLLPIPSMCRKPPDGCRVSARGSARIPSSCGTSYRPHSCCCASGSGWSSGSSPAGV